MPTFLTSTELPIVIEFPDDDASAVAQIVRQWIAAKDPWVMHFQEQNRAYVVNLDQIGVFMISTDEPSNAEGKPILYFVGEGPSVVTDRPV